MSAEPSAAGRSNKLGDARAYEGKLRTLKRTGALADLDAGRETLAEFVEEWWRVYAGPNLERATLRGYAILWNGHALPRLGATPLRGLSRRRRSRISAPILSRPASASRPSARR